MSCTAAVRIADFCKTGSGGTPSRSQMERYYEGGTIPWIKSGELRESVINHAAEYVTEAALKESSIKLVPAGAILLAMYGATVGRLGILGIEATTNQAICHIVPDPKLANTRYVFHAISNRVPKLIAMGVGGAQPNISQAIIKDLAIPLPPLTEQIRIAAILDQADALRVKRREALAQLDSLTQAIFIDMFGDPDSNPKSWVVKGLEEFCSFVNGGTPSKEVSDYFNGEIPWISSADIVDSKIQNVRHFITEMGVKNSSTNVVPADSILLVTRTGVGKVVITDMELCFSQDITALMPNMNIINKIYLTFYLKFKESYFQSMARGATIKGITRNVIESLKVPLPPLELQNNFAVRIQAIEMIKEIQKKSEFEFDSLFTSLQHRAFQGDL